MFLNAQKNVKRMSRECHIVHGVENGVMRDVDSRQVRTLTHGLTYELATSFCQ